MKHSNPILNTAIEIVTGLFILLFVYAAVSKLMDFEKFRVQLGQSPLLTAYAVSIAWVVPLVELILSVLLLFPKTRLMALYGSMNLMVLFSTYIVAITSYSEFIPCSCGGILQKMNWNQHLVFNLAFVALAIFCILVHPSIDPGGLGQFLARYKPIQQVANSKNG